MMEKKKKMKGQISCQTGLLTIYCYQDGSASSALMVCHGLIYIWSDLQAIPPHPLSVANQDDVVC